MFNATVINRFLNEKKYHLWLIAIGSALIFSELVVSVMVWTFIGVLTIDYLITAMVASVISSVTIYFFGKRSLRLANVQAAVILDSVGSSADTSLQDELQIAAIAFESQEGMIITDANGIILKINPSFTRITGYTVEDAVGQKMNLLKSGVHDRAFYSAMWESVNSMGSWQGEIWNRRKNGEIYPEWLTLSAVKDKAGNLTHYVGTMIDITTRKAIEQRIQHFAHHDALTDLPNRILLTDRLNQALAQVRRQDNMLALMFLDLDKFKPVNDLLGHDIGDLLLKEVAGRLLSCVKRESDTVSRIGGDEFVVLLPRIEHESDVEIIAHKILDAINQPFSIHQHNINISSSIGIAIYPQHGIDGFSLMKNADNAMYQAKNSGRNCFTFFTEDKNGSDIKEKIVRSQR